jgi:hypothetical protein
LEKNLSGKTPMNRSGSYPNHKNQKKNYFNRLDPPRGRPVGGGGVYHFRGYGGLNPHQQFLETYFLWEFIYRDLTLQALRLAAEAPRLR